MLTQNLDGRSGMLGQIDERSGMGNQTGANRFADQHRQIGSHREHPGLQIVGQMCAILVDGENFVAEVLNVGDVLLGNLRAHRDLGGLLHLLLHLLGQHIGQIGGRHSVTRSHQFDRLDERNVIGDQLSQFGEMPAVPRMREAACA